MERLAGGDQPVEPVGQLDLVAAAGFQRARDTEHLRLDDVAADDRQGRRATAGSGFSTTPGAHQRAVVADHVEHAVAPRLLARHLDDRDRLPPVCW